MSQIVACSFRVMLEHCYSRGWISEEDIGLNENYYLFIKHWYRTQSPFYFYGQSTHVIIIGNEGDLRSNSIEISFINGNPGGGVQ